jgi:hypothetical protein
MNATNALKAERWRDFLRSTKGEIFSVTFIKKDGSTRRLVGRVGVRKGVEKPGRFHQQDIINGIQRVYDFEKRSFRSIPLLHIQQVIWRGITW